MPRVPQQQQQQTNMEDIKKGAWSPEEDQKLKTYIMRYGIWNWRQMPKFAGLSRTGKSCRLRWMNYLRPDVKRGPFSMEEVEIVIKMYHEFGNRWSTIAARLPGRTDNEVKNFFHTHLKKHLGVKNDASMKTKGRKKRVINEKRNAEKSQERSVLGTTNYSSSLLSSDVASPCSSIITCEENQMMDIMNFSETFQGCRNVSSLVDQPVILESNPDTSGDIGVTDCQTPKLKMENSVILESNAEIFEDVGVAHCQLRQFEYSQPCSIFDNYIFNSDQFDLKSFWFDVIGDPEHLIF